MDNQFYFIFEDDSQLCNGFNKHLLKINDAMITTDIIFVGYSRFNQTQRKTVIEEFNIFTIAENGFFSRRLNDHLGLRKKLSDKGKLGAALRWKNGGAITLPNGDGNAKKERKEINKGDFLTKIVL